MIDVHDFIKEYPSSERILEYVSEYEIFYYYTGGFQVGKVFSSPLRKDSHPSFGIFPSNREPGKLLYKDFRGSVGDCFKLVGQLYGLNFKEALNQIIIDFDLTDYFKIDKVLPKNNKPITLRFKSDERPIIKPYKFKLRVHSRDWENYDLAYWLQYGIRLDDLILSNVAPIDYYYIGNKIYKTDKLAYAYKEYKDNQVAYKVYQPNRDSKNYKFINGFVEGTLSGWALLPITGNKLIITKSDKDRMFLFRHGYNVINPGGEGYRFKPHIVQELKDRFTSIIIFYDYDETGIEAMSNLKEEFGFNLACTFDDRAKDITDYYKLYGKSETMELLNELLC